MLLFEKVMNQSVSKHFMQQRSPVWAFIPAPKLLLLPSLLFCFQGLRDCLQGHRLSHGRCGECQHPQHLVQLPRAFPCALSSAGALGARLSFPAQAVCSSSTEQWKSAKHILDRLCSYSVPERMQEGQWYLSKKDIIKA